MKHLTLIRHAKSSWSDVSRGDFDRPLNARGLRDAPRMGAYLKKAKLPPVDRIVSSPALRARTTAELIAAALDVPNDSIVLEREIYAASLAALFTLVQGLNEANMHVVLVGHNPGFEQLAYALDPDFEGDGEKFPTCGVAQMELGIDTWSEIGEACAAKCQFVYPKLL
ncbi:phosphoglycerate mutase [Coraliomargarita sinensis]|uniref:Phosphoglycerate mutase n=1 Tax=Coraliomargarita sinensis TaxID=2174842 RepID=A0A317ZDR3_9BACT|nr:histidine phosphatase family protein [Coraliomargarita sinensis]PXA03455.1 phosphoglycerate mutase [Coraliomargarita sinensis]